MIKKEYDTIKELHCAIRNGDIEESKLEIILDNDVTSFYYNNEEIIVKETNGYSDITPLYRLLFQKADVQWC